MIGDWLLIDDSDDDDDDGGGGGGGGGGGSNDLCDSDRPVCPIPWPSGLVGNSYLLLVSLFGRDYILLHSSDSEHILKIPKVIK